ncbi:MAG: hypothetical protein NUV69_02140 [Candidatus Curtissbacteria bacterium]|nr:hypothetical protein [Candidatus Curtissbacteria bacterium]
MNEYAPRESLEGVVRQEVQHAEALNALVDRGGTKLAVPMMVDLLGHPTIRKLVVLGQPTAGKSTLIGQMIEVCRRVSEQTQENINVNITMYETHLKRLQTDTGISSEDPKYPWARLNWDIAREVSVRLDDHGGRSVRFVEIPGVGRKGQGVRDRAVSAFNRLAWISQSSDSHDTMFLYLIADPRAQRKAIHLRTAIPDLPDHQVVPYLSENLDIVVAGMDDSPNPGSEIKEIISRAAREEHINDIRREVKEITIGWTVATSQEAKEMPKPIASDSELSFTMRSDMRDEFGYMEQVFYREMGLSEQFARVGYNYIRRGTITWYPRLVPTPV